MGHVHFSRRAVLGASQIVLAGAVSRSLPSLAAGASGAPPLAVAPGTARLSANENPFGPGPAARAAISSAIGDSWKYPMAEEMALKARIAEREGVTPRHVLIGDGSSEILHLAAMAYGAQDAEVVTAWPTFSLLADHARTMGAIIREVPLDAQLRHDLAAMAAAVTAATRLVYVCNPNNPTGTVHPKAAVTDFIQRLLAKAPAAHVMVDEAYFEYVDTPGHGTLIPLALEEPRVLVLRTFSKVYGMAGLRVGYAVARPETIAAMQRFSMPMAVNGLGAAAAMATLDDPAHLERERKLNREAREFTRRWFEVRGCAVAPSATNFLMAAIRRPIEEFRKACAERGVAVGRPFPPLTEHARISIGTMEEMRRAVQVFGEVLGG